MVLLKSPNVPCQVVAVNHENETYFENGLVMGYADCKCYAGLVETLKVVSNCKPGPLSDALQAGACIFPPFPKRLDHVGKF